MGIGSLKAQNLDLLAKWWWRFKTEKDSMWKKVIREIHGEHSLLGPAHARARRLGSWSAIANLNRAFEKVNLDLNNMFEISIGNGSSLSFWTDRWCCRETLASRFPRSAALETDPRCSIADRIKRRKDGKVYTWN